MCASCPTALTLAQILAEARQGKAMTEITSTVTTGWRDSSPGCSPRVPLHTWSVTLYITVSTAVNYKSLLSPPEWYLQVMARSHYSTQMLNIMHRAKRVLKKYLGDTVTHFKRGYMDIAVML